MNCMFAFLNQQKTMTIQFHNGLNYKEYNGQNPFLFLGGPPIPLLDNQLFDWMTFS